MDKTCILEQHGAFGNSVTKHEARRYPRTITNRQTLRDHDRKPLYPDYIPAHPDHPDASDFQVLDASEKGKGLYSLRSFRRGSLMARFDGVTVPMVLQHSLQKSPGVHLHDPYFIGMLAHSCDPNVMLDMQAHEMWALKDITAGELLTMDYMSTEDQLFVTFDCSCGCPNCRRHITGRKQALPPATCHAA
eukprot:CAMPEP_0196657196 /NCGR_PEP_ID=MMETSP1086-20130531/22499_1 /TAXON_ID=77921 /ORGANISM="Cyanoptyche  gloeocystis , Strain SAG4.97" /LENGTH=189 /DNA_ID=CAMNT_0041990237 /DNA_START=58 /DNA_END=627 /DNA_ORIENTATION=-